MVTNVLPYLIALSALPLMMQVAGLEPRKYRQNVVVAVVAMLYSVYVIYASGKDAVFGGMLAWALAFLLWAFLAFRFAPRTQAVVAAA